MISGGLIRQPSAEGNSEMQSEETSDVAIEAAQDGAAVGSADAGNAGWADVMSRLLTAPAPKKKYVILSKAKKALPSEREAEEEEEREHEEPGPGFEVDGEEELEKEKKTLKKRAAVRARAVKRKEELEKRRKLREWESMGRKKPDVLEKDRERTLCKIATRGVVQLFNAVRQQQQEVQTKLKEAGGSLRKSEQALQAVSREAFLERLRSGAGEQAETPAKETDERATWSVLRDDYMPEAGLKDWDQDSDLQEDGGSAGESDDSA